MTTLTHEPGEGCGDCPFFGDEFDTCQAVVCGKHPDGRPLLVESSPEAPCPPAPDWCPLRSGAVTVSAPHAMQMLANRITAEHFPGMPSPEFVPTPRMLVPGCTVSVVGERVVSLPGEGTLMLLASCDVDEPADDSDSWHAAPITVDPFGLSPRADVAAFRWVRVVAVTLPHVGWYEWKRSAP